MDDGIAFLHDVDVSRSTHFREGDFTHLQFDKGTGHDMLSCLLAILKGNSATALLATILKSDVDEENPKYSRFDIPDRIVLSSLRMYVRRHGKLILDLVRAKPDDAPTPSTVDELTVHDLARYLNYLRWKDMTAEERREAMMPAHRALSNLREDMTAEQLREAMQPALNGLAEYQSGMTAEERREATQPMRNAQAENRASISYVVAPRPKLDASLDASWTAKFNKLEAYQAEHGNLSPPVGHELYAWTYTQRTFKKNHKLSNERIASLDGLGFEWDLRNATWTANFNKLEAYQADKGHLNLPNGHELYAWTYTQRSAKNNPKNNNKLNDEKIGLLDGLGFEW